MVVMKDVTNSHKNFDKNKKNDEYHEESASFSSLLSIKSLLSNNFNTNYERPAESSDTPKIEHTQNIELNKNTHDEEKNQISTNPPQIQQPTQSTKQDKLLYSDELYNSILIVLDSQKQRIQNNEKLDVSKLLPIIPKLVKNTLDENYMLLKALHPGRPSDWFSPHTLNTTIISIKIGFGLLYNTKQLYALTLSCLLHDVGMLKIGNDILEHSGKLSSSQKKQVANHPQFGVDLVSHLSSKYPFISKTIYEEHENWDGSGYPQKLEGEAITPFARILALSDKFESLVHERSYRSGYKPPLAIQKIIQEDQNTFDPKILKSFINVISMYPIGSYIQLNTGQTAQVMSINKNRPVRPVVNLLTNSDGKTMETPEELNLEKEPLIYITKVVNYFH